MGVIDGHLAGEDKTKEQLKETLSWPGYTKDICDSVRTCSNYATPKPELHGGG